MTRKPVSEEKLSKLVIDFARGQGWLVAHFHPVTVRPGRTVTPVSADGKGFPDLVLARERVLFVELKREHTRALRLEQKVWREQLLGAGAEWYLWNPVDWRTGKIQKLLEAPVPTGNVKRYERILRASSGDHQHALAVQRTLDER